MQWNDDEDNDDQDQKPADRCCEDAHPLVYRTIRRPRWTVRYRRCRACGATSKTVSAGEFVDERRWDEWG
jgi:hypothetical protein